MRYRIVETDNFGGDYPNEKFVNLPPMSEAQAAQVARAINAACGGPNHPRYWQVKPETYELQPGFEP